MDDAAAYIDALDAAELPDEQRRVANFVLRYSIGEGRPNIAVYDRALAAGCHLRQNKARWALRCLVRAGVMLEERLGGGLPPALSINPDTASWRTIARDAANPTKE